MSVILPTVPLQRTVRYAPKQRVEPRPARYPLPRPNLDRRFTPELIEELARVLVAHGYPEPTSCDRGRLARAVFEFLFARRPAVPR